MEMWWRLAALMKNTSASLIRACAADGLNRPHPGCLLPNKLKSFSVINSWINCWKAGGWGWEGTEKEERISQPRGGEALEGGGYDGADSQGKAEGI